MAVQGPEATAGRNSFSQVKPVATLRIFCTQQVNREINQVNGS